MFHLIDNIWKPPRSMEAEADVEAVFTFSWKQKQIGTASTSLQQLQPNSKAATKTATLLLNYWKDFQIIELVPSCGKLTPVFMIRII